GGVHRAGAWSCAGLRGLGATKIRRSATRALELPRLLAGEDLEPMFLALLAEARSNLRDYSDGADVYRRLVAPSRVAHERLAAQEAILSLFVPRPRELVYGAYRVKRFGERRARDRRFGLVTGRIHLTWLPTAEANELAYAVLHVGPPHAA